MVPHQSLIIRKEWLRDRSFFLSFHFIEMKDFLTWSILMHAHSHFLFNCVRADRSSSGILWAHWWHLLREIMKAINWWAHKARRMWGNAWLKERVNQKKNENKMKINYKSTIYIKFIFFQSYFLFFWLFLLLQPGDPWPLVFSIIGGAFSLLNAFSISSS